MGRGIIGWLALGAALAAASYARPAAGQCAACACGDPTLTSMGAEQPFAGRLRASLDVTYRSDRIGDPSADEARVDEVRAAPALSWPPAREWSLAATLPLVLRDVAYPNGAHDRALAPGDLDLRGVAGNFTAIVQRDFGPAIAARLGADARVEAPTTMQGQPERDSGGFVLYATTGVLASFATDFVLDIRVSIPTLQMLRGFHREGVMVGLGAVYDL